MKNYNGKECQDHDGLNTPEPREKSEICRDPGETRDEVNLRTTSSSESTQQHDLVRNSFPSESKFSTNAIHGGKTCHDEIQRCRDQPEFDPSRETAERCLAALEGAKHCVLVSSEKAGVLITCYALLPGDHVLCVGDVNGEFGRCFIEVVDKMNISTSFLESCDVAEITSSLRPNTRLLWLESPTNPTLRILPMGEIIGAVRARNHDVIVAVDNTLMSPYYQRPLDLGADISFHSASAYVDGGSDTHLGVLIFNCSSLDAKIRSTQSVLGLTPSQLDCFLLSRSVKTLSLRMQEHSNNALKVARCLKDCPNVIQVHYPGLPSDPHHELCRSQSMGFGGIVSFRLSRGHEDADKFKSNLKLFSCQGGIGGYESRVCLFPDSSSCFQSNVLIRLSVGLEDPDDLLNDLKQALKSVEESSFLETT